MEFSDFFNRGKCEQLSIRHLFRKRRIKDRLKEANLTGDLIHQPFKWRVTCSANRQPSSCVNTKRWAISCHRVKNVEQPCRPDNQSLRRNNLEYERVAAFLRTVTPNVPESRSCLRKRNTPSPIATYRSIMQSRPSSVHASSITSCKLRVTVCSRSPISVIGGDDEHQD